jgi:hypothetical protein
LKAFSSKTTTEQIRLGFNFARLLAYGETISAATFSVALVDGVDANPSAMLSGSAIVDYSPIIRQLVIGGTAGNTYQLQASITTSLGQVFVTAAELEVV